jgi:hypothetical protein
MSQHSRRFAGFRDHGVTSRGPDSVSTLELYHATDETGAEGIRQSGFARSGLADSPSASWLSASREGAVAVAGITGWIVVVRIPSEIAEQHRHRFPDGEPYLDYYLVPWSVLNDHRPFTFERR